MNMAEDISVRHIPVDIERLVRQDPEAAVQYGQIIDLAKTRAAAGFIRSGIMIPFDKTSHKMKSIRKEGASISADTLKGSNVAFVISVCIQLKQESLYTNWRHNRLTKGPFLCCERDSNSQNYDS